MCTLVESFRALSTACAVQKWVKRKDGKSKTNKTKITQTCGNRTLFTCRHQTLIFHWQKLKPDFPLAHTEAWLSTGTHWSLTFHWHTLKPDFPLAHTEAWLSTGKNWSLTFHWHTLKPDFPLAETEAWLSTCRNRSLTFHRQKLKLDPPQAETEARLSTGRNWSLTFHRQEWLKNKKKKKKPSLKHEETELFLIAETKLCIPISCWGFPFSTPARPLSSTQRNKTTSKNKHPWGGGGEEELVKCKSVTTFTA